MLEGVCTLGKHLNANCLGPGQVCKILPAAPPNSIKLVVVEFPDKDLYCRNFYARNKLDEWITYFLCYLMSSIIGP